LEDRWADLTVAALTDAVRTAYHEYVFVGTPSVPASKLVEVLFAIGVVINLMKAGDILLLPSQRRSVKRAMDTLALKLDATRPLIWIRKVTSEQWRLITWTTTIAVIAITVWSFVHYRPTFYGVTPSPVEWIVVGVAFFVAGVIRLGVAALVFGSEFVTWMLEEAPLYWPTFRRFCAILVLAVTLYFTISWCLWRFPFLSVGSFSIPGVRAHGFAAFALSGAGLTTTAMAGDWAWFGLVTPPLIAGAAVLLLGVAFAVAALPVALLRAIAWRVAEYDKGAWAALIALITVLLGFCDLWIRLRVS